MASKPCVLATCRNCRPGRPCAESHRWESDEDYYEDKDNAADAWLAEHWKRPSRPPSTFFSIDDPYPITPSGLLRDDPARDCS